METAAQKPAGSLQDSVRLTPNQIQEFFEIGYVVVPNLFSTEEIAEVGEALDRLQKLAQSLGKTQIYKGSQFVVEGSRIDRIVWIAGAEPSMLKYGEDPRLGIPCGQLLGSEAMEQIICQAHYKLPGDSVKFDWHQDSQHRGFGTADWQDINGRGSFVQSLIAIDEVTEDNGPLVFAPGTVKLGHLSLDQHPNPQEYFDKEDLVPLLMQPGDTAFFHPYVIHGSTPNNSNRSRRVFINGFAYPGANRRQYPGDGSGRLVTTGYRANRG